jgi:hypothetical protein
MKKTNKWEGKEFYYAPYDITEMVEDKGFRPGEKVVVLGEVGDPMKKFVYVSGPNNKIASVSKKSLSKEYPTTLLKLMGVPEEEDKKSNKKLVKV